MKNKKDKEKNQMRKKIKRVCNKEELRIRKIIKK